MPKPSHRERILSEGMKVVHAHGFANASVRDIVRAAGVPQGSFTNHFATKEAFGLEVIDLYAAKAQGIIDATLRNEKLTPLARLDAFIDASRAEFSEGCNGCLLGNFAAEATDHSEEMRARLNEKFGETRAAIEDALSAAVTAGELPADFECAEVAAFIQSALQGASLLAKAEQNNAPIDRFKRLLFAKVLR